MTKRAWKTKISFQTDTHTHNDEQNWNFVAMPEIFSKIDYVPNPSHVQTIKTKQQQDEKTKWKSSRNRYTNSSKKAATNKKKNDELGCLRWKCTQRPFYAIAWTFFGCKWNCSRNKCAFVCFISVVVCVCVWMYICRSCLHLFGVFKEHLLFSWFRVSFNLAAVHNLASEMSWESRRMNLFSARSAEQ